MGFATGEALEGANAFDLILSGDRTLFAIVRLSLLITLSATVLAALVGMPFGAVVALTRFPGRDGGGGIAGVPPAVALRAAGAA
jgi:tungstate transport system permease protein